MYSSLMIDKTIYSSALKTEAVLSSEMPVISSQIHRKQRSSIMIMEAEDSSETSVRHVPNYRALHPRGHV
jgi:hypothetical protein